MTMLRTTLSTEEIRPNDVGYDHAARVFGGTGQPEVILRPRDHHGVANAIAMAGQRGLPLSVRSGGHSPLGHGTNIGGVVVDMTHLNDVHVLDADRRLVRIGSGATWARVGAALDPLGWAITAGDTAGVGVGGLTLAGGFGWMVRRYGLAIDNLAGARVVTAHGQLVSASADENPDLFWALRGGGGNFGVVVDVDFIAQPVAVVHFGSVRFEPEDPAMLLARWRDVMRDMPDEVSSTFALLPAPAGSTAAAMVLLCYAGDPDATDADVDGAIDPLLGIGTVARARIQSCRYADVLEDESPPAGGRMAVRNTLVGELDEGVIKAIGRIPAGGSMAVAIRGLGGAFGRVSPYATAFAHRDAEAMVIGAAMLPGAASDSDMARALAPWAAVAAHGTGCYIGFQGSATPEDLSAAYPPATYRRLARIKRAYDPGNLFARNHNVEPTPVTAIGDAGIER